MESTIGEYRGGTLISSSAISDSTPSFGGANAFSVQVRYQSSDFSIFSNAASPGITTPPRTLPTVAVTPSSTAGASGLSSGTKAGIGIGVVIVVLGFALLSVMLLVYRQRGRMPEETVTGVRRDAYDYAARVPVRPPRMADVPPPSSTPDRTGQPYMEAHHVPADPGMMQARHQGASELAGSAPEGLQTQGDVEGDRSEDVWRRLNRAREEREESLARIAELNRLEEALESQLANRGQNVNGSAAGV